MLDSRKHKLPRFFAENSNRIPTFNDVELSKITASISSLVNKVAEIEATVSKSADNGVMAPSTSQSMKPAVLSLLPPASRQSAPSGQLSSSESSALSATAELGKDSFQWVMVGPGGRHLTATPALSYAGVVEKKPASLTRRKITGTRADSGTSKISASTTSSLTEKQWHVFIGKMNKDVDESDVKTYLEENDIAVTEVRKLKPLKDWQENHAAFRVSVKMSCKDSIMNCDLWPNNVVVRDWVFKPKDTATAQS